MGRDVTKLHPYLRAHFESCAREYARLYPEASQPFLSETWRDSPTQTALYAQGRHKIDEVNKLRDIAGMARISATENKRTVTNARPDQSLHCYLPACAYDIAFKTKSGHADWDPSLFKKFAVIAKKDPKIEWGGDWKKPDNPHFQFAGYTWQMAKAGIPPSL